MKTLKLAVVALSLGFFAASCGNSETTNENTVDTTAAAPMETPAPEAAPATVDTTATPAPVDTTATPAPAAH